MDEEKEENTMAVHKPNITNMEVDDDIEDDIKEDDSLDELFDE